MVTAVRFVAIGALVLGCSQAGGPSSEGPAPAVSQAKGIVIGQVVTHDAKVAIVGGGRELRVVIRKLDGTLIADGITLDDLRARDAELYEVVTSARASATDTRPSSYIDATLDLGHIN